MAEKTASKRPFMVLRHAGPAERPALEELQWRASLVHPAYRGALLQDRSIVHLSAEHLRDGSAVVAEVDGKVAGFAIILSTGSGEAELDGLFVEPEMAGQGIGRALVEDARQRARVSGATVLKVVAALEVENFYRRCGFELAGETETLLGKALVMVQLLRD
ncbi:GNAT family N-acetyltransferase [Mesorhizobium sp. 1M-11]|uniref:GNAT family N-acetyltransferase n=1 Tax=Mesorhizobium sp. 1M-11 TaxID=1529006 RepID=UPI0009E9ABA4|nr:GNAT family N-acetyltransferase [Mesorhizobium sp. 1M-11]